MKRGYDQNPPQPKRKHQSSRGGRGYGGQQRYSHNGQQSHTSRRQPDQQHYQPHHRNDWNDDHRFAFSRTYDQQERTSAIQQQPPQKHQEIVTVDMPTWQSMSYEQKLQQLLPDEVFDDIPELNFRANFLEKQQDALEKTLNFARDVIATQIRSSDGNESDSDASSGGGIPVGTTKEEELEHEFYPYLKFIQALPECLPMTVGFHLIYGNDKWCYCPLGRKMKTWRKQFGLDLPDTCGSAKSQKPFGPRGLVAHVQEKMKDSLVGGCFYHKIVEYYLLTLYKNYLKEGIHHKALYDLNDDGFKRAEKYEMKEVHSALRRMQEELEIQQNRIKALLEKEHQIEALKQTNRDLAEKLQEQTKIKKDLLKKLNISPSEKKPEISEKTQEIYRKQHVLMMDGWRYQRHVKVSEKNDMKEKRKINDYRKPIDIKVSHEFDLQGYFELWYATNHFLFQDLDGLTWTRWLGDIEVVFEVDSPLEVKNNKLREEMSAIDAGGPSRDFLSNVWRQIGDLSIQRDGKHVRLFERTALGMCKPVENAYLDLKLGIDSHPHKMLKAFYRTVGRLMLYSLQKQYPIADHVLPRLYRNILFRGIEPIDQEYLLEDLVNDVVDLGGWSKEEDSIEVKIGKYYETFCEEPSLNPTDFRKHVQESFIGNMDRCLSSLKDGISLDGRINPTEVFSLTPIEIVNALVFSRSKIEPEDVITAIQVCYDHPIEINNDSLKKAVDGYQRCILNEIEIDGKKVLTGALPDMLRESKDDAQFLEDFVYFVTGYRYIPNARMNKDFRIIVEFNLSECGDDDLPVAHTCVLTVKIPGMAYYGNKEIFVEKLKKSIELSGNRFNMN